MINECIPKFNFNCSPLPRVATLLQKMAADLDPKSRSNPEYRLVDAAESWYIGGSTRRVVFVIFTSESSAKNSGLWDTASLNFDLATVSSATKRLASKMLASLKPGDGYTIEVQVKTLRGIYASDFLVLSEWVIEKPGDAMINKACFEASSTEARHTPPIV